MKSFTAPSIVLMALVISINYIPVKTQGVTNGQYPTQYGNPINGNPQSNNTYNLNVVRGVLSPSDRVFYIGDYGGAPSQQAHVETVHYNGFPYLIREKYFSFTDPHNRIIKMIKCTDNSRSLATVQVSAGGVGSSFVTLTLTSERGHEIDFTIEIFV